jgi:hypothetical protein
MQFLLLAVLLWLCMDADAHARLHERAGSTDDQCAVTLLAQGKVSLATPVTLTDGAPAQIIFLPALPATRLVCDAPYWHPYPCGPPRG